MDERLANIEKNKQDALNQSNNMFNGLLQNNKDLYNQQLDTLNKQETIQNDMLDKQLAYNKSLIEQQRENAKKNYETESHKALNDYTAYNNPYGYQAEARAQNGLLNSGISETSKLGSFNVYQNRLATANKVMQDAITQYDNDMNQAILNNDVKKAEFALEKLKLNLGYSESFYNKNSELMQNQFSTNQNIDNNYYNRYQNEYANIQNEQARQEAIRQWEAEMQYKKDQAAQAQQNWEKEYALSKQAASSRGSGGSGGYVSGGYSLSEGSSGSSGTISGATGSALGALIGSSGTKTSSNKTSSNKTDDLGNSATTQKKSDFYFKNPGGQDYQPRYINNIKLSKTGKTLANLEWNAKKSFNLGVSNSKNIWKAGNKYYVWAGKNYYEVTSLYNKYK